MLSQGLRLQISDCTNRMDGLLHTRAAGLNEDVNLGESFGIDMSLLFGTSKHHVDVRISSFEKVLDRLRTSIARRFSAIDHRPQWPATRICKGIRNCSSMHDNSSKE
jgi:hypothetical protein